MNRTQAKPKTGSRAKAARAAVGFVRAGANGAGGTDAQSKVIAAAAKARGLKLAVTHRDADERQDAFRLAVTEACEQRAVLIVASLACLARSAPGCIRIARRLHGSGADLIAVADGIDTTQPSRSGFFPMMELLGGLEIERLRQARQAPFGFDFADDDGHLVANPREQAIIQRVIELRRGGAECEGIAGQLNQAGGDGSGCRPRGRKSWDGPAVREILRLHPTSRWMLEDEEN